MKSLFIISCPKSMSSLVHNLCQTAIDFKSILATDGEVLNHERVIDPISPEHKDYYLKGQKFWTGLYWDIQFKILDQITEDGAHLIKDVCFPHVVRDYVYNNHENTIIIDKDPRLITYSLQKVGWFYPSFILDDENKTNDMLKDTLLGVVKMKNNLMGSYDKEFVRVLDTKKFRQNPDIIFDILESLGYQPDRDFLTEEFYTFFKMKSDKVEKYKDTEIYSKIDEMYQNL